MGHATLRIGCRTAFAAILASREHPIATDAQHPGHDEHRVAQLAVEQQAVDVLYARLDELRDRTRASLADVRAAGASGTHQARSERDAFAVLYESRLAQLEAAEDRLCFGRLDLQDGGRHHIGRLGMSDDDQRQLLLDWRAPAAMPFYQATAVDRQGAVLRRHLTTVGRVVTHLEDDVLDVEAVRDSGAVAVSGEGALLAALTAGRTGRMGDIVATIQAEQDVIIRSDLGGVLVVQGGPGTGKTAVALHRAAYLLYTHRERLERTGVLLVGPSPVFLRYIDQVLPSLGETGVVTTTIGDLLPGVRTSRHDRPEVAALKGDPRMVEVLRAAVTQRQRVPAETIELVVRGIRLQLRPTAVERARHGARGSGRTHNRGRERFLTQLMDDLARQLARGLRLQFDSDSRAGLLADLRESRDVRRELNLLWLPLTPAEALSRLYTDPAALAAATPGWRAADRALLRRDDGAAWTVEDVPLLDELAELVGDENVEDLRAERARAAQRRTDLEQARRVLQMGSTVPGMIGTEAFAERWAESGPVLSVAERAAGDRTWTYGHVIVDEAQELSPMAWRSLMRRCPRRSMTLVGDLAQSASAAAARSWHDLLDPHAAGAWRLEELTITYRTPGQIMRVAADVLVASESTQVAPVSVREGDWEPLAYAVERVDAAALAPLVRDELELLDGGRLAVVVPRAERPDAELLAHELTALLRDTRVGWGADALDETVAVLDVQDVKGLEFDAVILCEPADVVERGVGGWGDLYVALTRPTQRLRVVHARPLPAGMQRLGTGSAPYAAGTVRS